MGQFGRIGRQTVERAGQALRRLSAGARWAAAGLAFLIPVAATAEAPPVAQKTQFVRFLEDRTGGGLLETAAVTYRNADGVQVTLIGAVHIADADYFNGLDASFDQYDALLYEMVKPRDAVPGQPTQTARRREGMLGWVGPMQRFMRDHLDLTYQMDEIRYADRPNFVHADLDADTFVQLQSDRDEGFLRLFLRAYRVEAQRQRRGETTPAQQITPFHLMAAMKAPDRSRQLKLLFARQLGDIDAQMGIFEGPNGSVIITERNKKAFEVLDEQIEAGKRNIGIFYGAGHFPDMEKRLIQQGFRRVGQTWRTAWDMRVPATQPALPVAD